VYIVQTLVRDTSDLTRRLIDTLASIAQNPIDKVVGHWRKRLRATMKAKWHHFEHLLFSEPTNYTTGSFQRRQQSSDYRRKHVISRHFHLSYLKANKLSKSEWIRKVEYAYHLCVCADAADRKLSKLVHACRNYSLPNLARFLWDTFFCVLSNILERIIIGRLSNHLERNIYTTLFTFRQN